LNWLFFCSIILLTLEKFLLMEFPSNMCFKVNKMIRKIFDIYNKLQLKLFLIPFLNIDRERFLRKNVGDKLLEPTITRRRSRIFIILCCILTSFFTFLCTLPSEVWISMPLIVVDFAQFQFFVFVIQQQLLYLHGYNDLRVDSRIDDKNGFFLLWLQNEVMLSSGESIRSKIKSGVGFVVRKAITLLFTKSPFRIVLISAMRQILKWCGVIATHQVVDVSVDLFLCMICALVAALVSLWQFYPMCRKLRKELSVTDLNYYYDKWQTLLAEGHTIDEIFNVSPSKKDASHS
jgi:hypothetical protein